MENQIKFTRKTIKSRTIGFRLHLPTLAILEQLATKYGICRNDVLEQVVLQSNGINVERHSNFEKGTKSETTGFRFYPLTLKKLEGLTKQYNISRNKCLEILILQAIEDDEHV